jgi:hypothetical protein
MCFDHRLHPSAGLHDRYPACPQPEVGHFAKLHHEYLQPVMIRSVRAYQCEGSHPKSTQVSLSREPVQKWHLCTFATRLGMLGGYARLSAGGSHPAHGVYASLYAFCVIPFVDGSMCVFDVVCSFLS